MRRSERIAARLPVVDEWGKVPRACAIQIDEDDIPLSIRALQYGIKRNFQLTRQYFATNMGPGQYPVNQEFEEWGRRWMIKESTIPSAGLGLFAGEDIIVDPEAAVDRKMLVRSVPLFPYVGATYMLEQYDKLVRWYPHMRRYVIQLERGSYANPKQLVHVGFAREDKNLSAYINSTSNTRKVANVEWQHVNQRDPTFLRYIDHKCQRQLDVIQNQPEIKNYCMTVATTSIAKGKELLIDYDIE